MIELVWIVEVLSEGAWRRAAEQYATEDEAKGAIDAMIARGHERERFRCRMRLRTSESIEAELLEDLDRGFSEP
jgi:hypothetical protein